MRIIHINLEQGWRGGERQTLYLMQGLKRLGHENTLIARRNGPLAAKAGAEGFAVKEIGKPFCLFAFKLAAQADIIQTHETRALQLAALFKAWHKKPLVHTRRVDFIPSKRKATVWKYKKADKVVAISGKIGYILEAWGVARHKIEKIPSAVCLEHKANEKQVQKLQTEFAGRVVIGNIGSLVGHKDHFTLLDTAEYLSRTNADLVFVILGNGPLLGRLKAQIAEKGLHNVFLLGYQDDPYSYFALFDIFLVTSKEEGLCSSILDAFFYRVPVVATNAGGIPELVQDQKTGLLAPVQNPQTIAKQVNKMLNDRQLREQCIKNALTYVKNNHSIDTMAKSYSRLYSELLSP